METPSLVVVGMLTLAGFLAGLVDSIAGGGGLVTVPALLAAGLPPHTALATNKGQSIFGSLTSFSLFLRSGRIDRRRLVPTFVAAVIGSAVGAALVLRLDKKLLAPIVIVLLVIASCSMLVRRRDGEHPLPWVARAPRLAAASIALVLGAYDGFFGPGTGTFLVVAFAFCFGDDLVRASANAKVANFASNLAAFLTFFGGGAILWRLALPMGLAQILGASVGTRLALTRGAALVRTLTVVMALAIAARLAFSLIR
jgi:uncharacterized protein